MALSSLFPLGPRRSGMAAPDTLAQRRAAIAAATSPYPRAEGVDISQQSLAHVRCIVATPERGFAGEMIYFHGGGYSLGGPDRMTGFLTHLARRVGCRVIAPAYSLAPEAPYPAALHDAQAVIEAVIEKGDCAPLLLAGDSAGGGLAAARWASVMGCLRCEVRFCSRPG
jgi:monoterpene epsilon-lactone hydrolase